MAFVIKIQNGSGDGAGRSRYLLGDLKKVLTVSTNIPSFSLITQDYRTLADDFNRTLLARQGDYRTDHFVVSFQHRFTQEKLEEIIEIVETEFQKEFGEDRPYIIVVHAEEFKNKTPEEILKERIGERTVSKSPIHGTSFHIVLGRNTEGKGIRLGKREYLEFKRRIVEKLQPFANERERQVFQHFLEGKRTRAFYKRGELYKPEKNEKVWAKKILKDVTEALERKSVEEAIGILKQHNAEIKTFEISPYNKKKLKEPTPYIILPRLNGNETFAVRLKKAERALYKRYKDIFEELEDEYRRITERNRRIRERIREYRERNRRIGEFEKKIRNLNSKLRKIRRIGEELRETLTAAGGTERNKAGIGEIEEENRQELSLDNKPNKTDLDIYNPNPSADYISNQLNDEDQADDSLGEVKKKKKAEIEIPDIPISSGEDRYRGPGL